MSDILNNGVRQFNERTKQWVYANNGAMFFSIDLSHGFIPVAANRRYYPETAASELAWMLSGEKSIKWLKTRCAIWTQFADENGEVSAAYGHRMNHFFGRNQLADSITALKNDVSSRQIVINFWDAQKDGLLNTGLKNVPCPTQFILNVINGALHTTVVMRSSDVFVGLPYDVMVFAMLSFVIATELGVGNGSMSFVLSHAHIYEAHVADIVRSETPAPAIIFPRLMIAEILNNMDSFVDDVKEQSDKCEHSSFVVRPQVFL